MNRFKRLLYKCWKPKLLRKILAFLFLISILFLLIWSIKKDNHLNWVNKISRIPLKGGQIHYTIQLKSFDTQTERVNAILSVEEGLLPVWEEKEIKIVYGPLFYHDLSFEYIMGLPLWIPSYMPSRSFQTTPPAPIEITIKAFGNSDFYPFDMYFIMGFVRSPAYFMDGNKKRFLNEMEHGESLQVINSINGLFLRPLTKKEFDQIKAARASSPVYKKSPIDERKLREINNDKNMFAFILQRPYYVQFMTVILGIIVLGSAFYIGFFQSLKGVPISTIGFVVAVWGIRAILLSDTKIFLSSFDYVILFIYLLLLSGIIFRVIKGNASNKSKKAESQNSRVV